MADEINPNITIDDKVYKRTDLTPKCNLCVAQISDINNKLNKLEFDKTQLLAAKNAFSASLASAITEVAHIGTVNTEEPIAPEEVVTDEIAVTE